MTQVLGIVGEDEGHYRVVTRIVDDVIRLRTRDLEAVRRWQGTATGERWHKYSRKDRDCLPRTLPNGRPIRLHGRFGNEPELLMWRVVLYLFAVMQPRPAAVVLCRDMDAEPERRKGMLVARVLRTWLSASARVLALAAALGVREDVATCGLADGAGRRL